MASVPTSEEIKALQKQLEYTRERVRGNRAEAIRLLKAAGISTENGELTPPYRPIQED